MKDIKVGDKARPSSDHLRNTGQYFDDGTHGWGEVVKVEWRGKRGGINVPQLVTVFWAVSGTTRKFIRPNLERGTI